MADSVRVVKAQIERVISGHGKINAKFWREAEFRLLDGWMCCRAWFEDDRPMLHTRGTAMTPEQAAIVAVSLQMAIDWLVEEKLRLTNEGR